MVFPQKENAQVNHAPCSGQRVFAYDAKAYGAQDYGALGGEVITRLEARYGA